MSKPVDVDAILAEMRKNRSDKDRLLLDDQEFDQVVEGASDSSLEELIEQLEQEEDIQFNI